MTTYGKDTSCTDTLRPGRMVSGARLVAESIYRRLTTPRGMLRGGEDEANFGFDLVGLLGASVDANWIESVRDRVRLEVLKDERVESVAVAITDVSTEPGQKAFLVEIDAITGEGPFELQIAVDEVQADLVGLEAAA